MLYIFSCFQIVAVQGINSTGDCLTVHQIINGCSPPERPAVGVKSSDDGKREGMDSYNRYV